MYHRLQRRSFIDKLIGIIERSKASDRLLLRLLFFATLGAGIFLALTFNGTIASVVPTKGGTLTEGIIGIPRFVNPALASTRTDLDVVALVYSGLLKINTEGELVPDVAERITVSEDGRTYNITLKRGVVFHDNTPLTAQDVVFTIQLIQNPDLRSPLLGNWSDVAVAEVNEYELTVTLSEPYAPFMENFTLGILPKHIWQPLPIEQVSGSLLNTEPIGSGPFQIERAQRDSSGVISSYILTPFKNAIVPANLSRIELRFYKNEETLREALIAKEVRSTAYLTPELIAELPTDNFTIIEAPLPRIFALFFNQNRLPALRDNAARQALKESIDTTALVDEVLFGYGVPTSLPILNQQTALQSSDTSLDTASNTPIARATATLESGGWRKNTAGLWEKTIDRNPEVLQITLRTSNAPSQSEAVVAYIASQWRALGVEVQIEQFEQSDLAQSVIRPRDFQVLFFGIDVNRSQDLYPWWHSSQKDDPGLNIAQYTNISVDRILTQARTEQDGALRRELLNEASTIIAAETPAVFLFSPALAYAVDTSLETAPLRNISRPSERFTNITEWYAETDRLWPLFFKQSTSAE